MPGICLSSQGFDSRLNRNGQQGRDQALPQIPMSSLMTKTHFLMCPTCPPGRTCLHCRKKAQTTLIRVFHSTYDPQLCLQRTAPPLHFVCLLHWVLTPKHISLTNFKHLKTITSAVIVLIFTKLCVPATVF